MEMGEGRIRERGLLDKLSLWVRLNGCKVGKAEGWILWVVDSGGLS